MNYSTSFGFSRDNRTYSANFIFILSAKFYEIKHIIFILKLRYGNTYGQVSGFTSVLQCLQGRSLVTKNRAVFQNFGQNLCVCKQPPLAKTSISIILCQSLTPMTSLPSTSVIHTTAFSSPSTCLHRELWT